MYYKYIKKLSIFILIKYSIIGDKCHIQNTLLANAFLNPWCLPDKGHIRALINIYSPVLLGLNYNTTTNYIVY